MKLIIAGGVREHGRNCFYIEDDKISFLLDCGIMADGPNDPYPRLNKEQIEKLDIVFVSHSHLDHTGALGWLIDNGFKGKIVASKQTLKQISLDYDQFIELEDICKNGEGFYKNLNIEWGRSGHCVGGVWYKISNADKSIIYSGDYVEDSLVYDNDPILHESADLAIIDCAYGLDENDNTYYHKELLRKTKQKIEKHGVVVFPVPKFGRGLEILRLFSDNFDIPFYGDDLFVKNVDSFNCDYFWNKSIKTKIRVEKYINQKRGLVFISDPQLKSPVSKQIVDDILNNNGYAIATGHIEKNSYSEYLIKANKMIFARYPVHLNNKQFNELVRRNNFKKVIAFHGKDVDSTYKLKGD